MLPLALWLIISALLSVPCIAQSTKSVGQPLIYNSTTVTTTPPGTTVDAYVYVKPGGSSGMDMCSKINDAWANALPSGVTSATIDARGFIGTQQQCQVQPMPNTVHGRLLLGNVTINTTFGWLIPAGVEVVGLGALSTTIKAKAGFQGGALIEMGNGSSQFGVKIKALAVDCNSAANCIGVENMKAEEGSNVEDVSINNAPLGLNVMVGQPGAPLAANSGPYRNITVQYPSCTCSDSIGVQVTGSDSGMIVRGLDNITISGSATGIHVLGVPVRISNSTISSTATGLLIDELGNVGTHNVLVENVYFSGTDTGIYASPHSSDIYLSNVSAAPTVALLLNDQATVQGQTHVLGGPFVGFYMRGVCSDASDSKCVETPAGKQTALATSVAKTASVPIKNILWTVPDQNSSNATGVCTPTSMDSGHCCDQTDSMCPQ